MFCPHAMNCATLYIRFSFVEIYNFVTDIPQFQFNLLIRLFLSLLHGAVITIRYLSENEHRSKLVRTTETIRTIGNTKPIYNDGKKGKEQVQDPNSFRPGDRLNKNQPKIVVGANIEPWPEVDYIQSTNGVNRIDFYKAILLVEGHPIEFIIDTGSPITLFRR